MSIHQRLMIPKMKNTILLIMILFVNVTYMCSQEITPTKPKLIVGIVVDQMRFDQLYKYEEKYSDNGFKRLMKEGYNYKNAHYNYIPTVTASGHASIYTGTTPSTHGIIGNNWYDRYNNIHIGNVTDTTEIIVGSEEVNKNGVSPRNLLSTTISDQLRLGTNFNSKVISVSLKDRGAILPGGHTANASYWHDWQTSPGHFVSSSYYMDTLPKWVKDFNDLGKSSTYLDTVWNTLYPIESYTESSSDDNSYERVLRGKDKPTFPYNFRQLRETYRELNAEYQMIWVSPHGNSLLTEFAVSAIENEKLGEDEVTDLINISYSVPDVIGHTFGLQSIELEDIYLRLDKDIEKFINFLDSKVGRDQYVMFLTSDHGAIPVTSYLNERNLPSGIAKINDYKTSLKIYLDIKYGENDWVQEFKSEMIYLNRPLIAQHDLLLSEVQQIVADFLLDQHGIANVLTAHQLKINDYSRGMKSLVQNGYHPKRSGDLILTFDPGFIDSATLNLRPSDVKGTTHGSGYAYDTHVPVLWFGCGIPSGESTRKIAITDIAPSLAMLLNLQLPSGSTGEPLFEILEREK